MPTQNQNEWNSSQFNYFAPAPAEIVAKQIATPEDLAFKDSKKNKKNDGASGKEGLLVQNSLSEEPVSIGQRNVPNVNVNPVEKKTPVPSKPTEEEPSDFFAQFNQPAKESAAPAGLRPRDSASH